MRTLIIGIGNIGRQDDGLAWQFLDIIKEKGFPEEDICYRYQLQIEDAELLRNYNKVIFVDAAKIDTDDGFFHIDCGCTDVHGFTSHELAPETILFLSNKLYKHKPTAEILGIQGFEWDLKLGLSENAKINLCNTLSYFQKEMTDCFNY